MSKMNVFQSLFTKLIIVSAVLAVLVSCSKSEEKDLKVRYLLPELGHKYIESIELKSEDGATKLIRKEGAWWIDSPLNYYANHAAIESFLLTITDAKIGKKISVAPADFAELSVDDGGDGISVDIRFGESEQVKLIIGELDFPDDQSAGLMLGYGSTARRYVRVIGGRGGNDDVYLATISLVGLTAKPIIWMDQSHVRIPSFRNVKVKSGDTLKHEFFRNEMFGALYHRAESGEDEKAHPQTFSCFEDFLKVGRVLDVAKSDAKFEPSDDSVLVVEDFLGMTYTFRLGLSKEPTEKDIERYELQTGFFNDGIAPVPISFMLDTQSTEMKLNRVQQSLKDQNLKVSNQLASRVVYGKLKEMNCIFDLFEGSR